MKNYKYIKIITILFCLLILVSCDNRDLRKETQVTDLFNDSKIVTWNDGGNKIALNLTTVSLKSINKSKLLIMLDDRLENVDKLMIYKLVEGEELRFWDLNFDGIMDYRMTGKITEPEKLEVYHNGKFYTCSSTRLITTNVIAFDGVEKALFNFTDNGWVKSIEAIK